MYMFGALQMVVAPFAKDKLRPDLSREEVPPTHPPTQIAHCITPLHALVPMPLRCTPSSAAPLNPRP